MPGALESPVPARFRPRYGVVWSTTLRCKDWRRAAQVATANVSRGGAFLRTADSLEIGTPVAITLHLPNGLLLQLGGIVIRTDKDKCGIAVAFDSRHAVDLMLLEQMALSHTDPIR